MTAESRSEGLRRLVLALLATMIIFGALVPGTALAERTSDTTEVARRMSPTEYVRAIVQPSIVRVTTEYSAYAFDTYNRGYVGNGPFSVTRACTGFFVNPEGWVVTAGHCAQVDRDVRHALKTEAAVWTYESGYFEDTTLTLDQVNQIAMDYYELEGVDGERGRVDRKVTISFGISLDGIELGRSLPARVQDVRPFDEGDVALLKIDAADVPALELASDDLIAVGTETVSVGYAGSVDIVTEWSWDPSFKQGTISSVRTRRDGLFEVYETSSAITGGMSGGPTVNLDGEVVGLNSFGVVGESQPFNFISAVSAIREILQKNGVDNAVGGSGEIYRSGIDAYVEGDKVTATELLQEVLNRIPNHQLAEEYLALAQKLSDPVEPTETTPTGGDRDDEPQVEEINEEIKTTTSGSWTWLLAGFAITGLTGASLLARGRRDRRKHEIDVAADPRPSPNGTRDHANDAGEAMRYLLALHEQGVISTATLDAAKKVILS